MISLKFSPIAPLFAALSAFAVGCGHPSRAIGTWKGDVNGVAATLILEPNLNGKLLFAPISMPSSGSKPFTLQPPGVLYGWRNINQEEVGLTAAGNISGTFSAKGKLNADGTTLTLTQDGQEFTLAKG